MTIQIKSKIQPLYLQVALTALAVIQIVKYTE
jgi:hypothetical protein